jgi:hypothetical protein
MEDNSRNDIRKLLKTFGINADEIIIAHLARNPEGPDLKLRISLQDLTDYGPNSPDQALQYELDGTIRR